MNESLRFALLDSVLSLNSESSFRREISLDSDESNSNC